MITCPRNAMPIEDNFFKTNKFTTANRVTNEKTVLAFCN
jgi:hypothetical protein